jgi:transcriptional regulator with XRE-family HTH domain
MKIRINRTIIVKGLGKAIRKARKADVRTLKELAALIDVTTQTWDRIEREQQSISIEMLRKIEEVLGKDFGIKI